jgi:hypothetical protein
MPKRRGRAADSPATPTFTTTTDTHHGTDPVESIRCADLQVDLRLLGGPEGDVWAALFDGRFRLAVPCSRCGRWLTAGASKSAGIGPHCAALEDR